MLFSFKKFVNTPVVGWQNWSQSFNTKWVAFKLTTSISVVYLKFFERTRKFFLTLDLESFLILSHVSFSRYFSNWETSIRKIWDSLVINIDLSSSTRVWYISQNKEAIKFYDSFQFMFKVSFKHSAIKGTDLIKRRPQSYWGYSVQISFIDVIKS